MSNIYTSNIRIQRRDGAHLGNDEIETLFQKTVNVHGEFGSYWVRIVKKYRPQLKCLDIQFGSGKRTEDPFDDPALFELYRVTERINYEGSLDHITEYYINSGHGYASTAEPRVCKYAFDKIHIHTPAKWPDWPELEQIGSSEYRFKHGGIYHSSNCKSFVDLDEETPFYGPCLQYTDDYAYDYFVLNPCEQIDFLTPDPLISLGKNDFEKIPDDSKLTFYFRSRKVLEIHKLYGREELYSADYWDNCIDEIYLRNIIK